MPYEAVISSHCNVDRQTEKGGTPLHAAAQRGHAGVTKQLLAARCNIDLQVKDGRTALQVAEIQGHTQIARLIRSKKKRF